MRLELAELEDRFRVRLSTPQRDQVAAYLSLLEKWNRRLNLTSLRERSEILRFHFFESFWAAQRFLPQNQSLADVGSGAGFPGAALALFRPDLQITLLEKNHKKVVFLRQLRLRLGLELNIFSGHAEQFRSWPQQNWATWRAVKASSMLLGVLARHRVHILWFHTARAHFLSPDWSVRDTEQIPETRSRFVSHLVVRSAPAG